MFGEWNPAAKPKHSRRVKKRRERGRIKPETYRRVFGRDGGKCVLCGYSGAEIECHHYVYRSQLGKGTEDNLVLLCVRCHDKVHEEPKKYKPLLGDYLNKLYPGGMNDEER